MKRNFSCRPRFIAIRFHRVVMLLCMTFLFFAGALSASEHAPRKKVRIPCATFNRLMMVDKTQNPVSGYAYEYIQAISVYAGWDVEFIPCKNFSDGINLLLSGEADLFYDISYTEERSKAILFPEEPMGSEYYYLYTTNRNFSITHGDYSSMNGKTVGVTTGTMQIELLKEWCAKKNVNLEVVEYATIPDKEADLFAGKIDLDLEVSMLAQRSFSAIEKIGSSAYYMAANKKRQDLIDDLNSAHEKLLNNDLYFFARLEEHYFSDTALSHNLTSEEKEWIQEHNILRVGFFNNYLPLCSLDERGRPIGAGIDAIREILNVLELEDKLEVEFICYDNVADGYKAVESEEVDLMLPAYVSNSVRHDYHIVGGKPLAKFANDLVYHDDYGEIKDKRIGINKRNLLQYYFCKDFYPDSEIVFYDDIGECLDGLLDGTSDATFLSGFRSEALIKPTKYHALRTVRARDDLECGMAFAEDNVGLMLLMNRGLTMLDPDFVNRTSYLYMARIYTYSMMDLIQDHIRLVIFAVAILVALIVAMIGAKINNRKLARVNRKLSEVNQKLTEHAEIIEKQRLQESELREQLEDALQMAQAANRAKTTFLSNMSHDIRTPMNAIIGFTGLAQSHIEDKDRVQDCLTTISQSSEHLLSLINDILDMSRIESGKMNLNEKEESLADIIRVVQDIVHADVRAKQHTFRIDAVNVRNESVFCDKLRLNQILLNLISNAIKYTHPGGTITLRIEQKPAAEAGYGAFEFRLRDNGIGMSEEFVKTIFDPFSREETSTVSGIQGTGLGMVITRNLVEMMGGKISVTSKKDEGSEFVVQVDFRLADRKASGPAIPELDGARGLVVAGDADTCRSLDEMLRETGMRVEQCVSGRDAVIRTEEAIRRGDGFRGFIVDMQMQDADGLETVRGIRNAAGKNAFIILIAYDTAGIENDAKEAGVNALIAKPVFPSNLLRALRLSCGKADPAQEDREEQTVSLKGKKVLLVDDNELNLKIGVLQLQQQGLIVDTARNGEFAVAKIRENGIGAYDFVLMDVQMPVMDGYEATGIIRKLPDGDKLKILAFSANAFEEDREKSLKAGMDGHISKPLKIKELLGELKRFGV